MILADSLLITLFERMSVIAMIAFLISRTALFRRVIKKQAGWRDRALFIAIFAGLGILGTYTGISVQGALANSRVIGPMVAGLLGGPAFGAAAGFLAGLHRASIGGFTALACAVSTLSEGIMGGLINKARRGRMVQWWEALLGGMAGEVLQMLIILAIARPFDEALALVRVIAAPMILANGVGIAIFMLIIRITLEEEESAGARQAQKALQIATRTLPFLRRGLTPESAHETAKVIYESTDFAAVAITDNSVILAFVGKASDHHAPGQPHITEATARALATRRVQIASTREEIGCSRGDCPLGSAIVVPLLRGDAVIGALKMYHTREHGITATDEQLASGLGHLFATQLALSEVEYQRELTQKARLAALQAQIHPHFLFNALNTIGALIRSDPDSARRLLIKLSQFLRGSFQKPDRAITLAEEMANVDAYVAIQLARFPRRLRYEVDVPAELLKDSVPPFVVQPLVENAIRHGLLENGERTGGTVTLVARRGEGGELVVRVTDDGVGMSRQVLERALTDAKAGIGLFNVNERLRTLYGPEYALLVDSAPGRGTTVEIRVPQQSIFSREVRVSSEAV